MRLRELELPKTWGKTSRTEVLQKVFVPRKMGRPNDVSFDKRREMGVDPLFNPSAPAGYPDERAHRASPKAWQRFRLTSVPPSTGLPFLLREGYSCV